ncbi:MAG TPA: hypothetical protein VKP69_23875 [Isosphaeraceae bacterium]|nr:hypothetical protein [Isosphaeraceae bacterium]
MWTCPKCGTKVGSSFEVCWACGTTADDVEDPNFVRAEDAGPIDTPPPIEPKIVKDELAAIVEDELAAPTEEAPSDEELVECYWARNVQEAKFLADQLIEQAIPAVADEQNLRYLPLVPWPLGPYFGPRIWVRAKDHDRARAWLEQYERKRKAHFDPGIAD